MNTVLANHSASFLSRIEVMKKTSLASATLDYLIEKGDFPKPHDEYAAVDVWKLSEVEAWVSSRQAAAMAVRNGQ